MQLVGHDKLDWQSPSQISLSGDSISGVRLAGGTPSRCAQLAHTWAVKLMLIIEKHTIKEVLNQLISQLMQQPLNFDIVGASMGAGLN